jgi:hypothetical protein
MSKWGTFNDPRIMVMFWWVCFFCNSTHNQS